MEEQYSTTGKIRLRNTKKFNFLYWQNPKIKYITMSMSEKAPEHKIKAENPKKIKLLSCKGRIILSHGQIRSRNTKKKSIFCTDKTQKSKEKSNTSQWARGQLFGYEAITIKHGLHHPQFHAFSPYFRDSCKNQY